MLASRTLSLAQGLMQWCDVQEDAYRGRSQSLESRKSKEPRRLTEKIAIMKRKEHEQSEAFEQAMRSIFEVPRTAHHIRTVGRCACSHIRALCKSSREALA